MANPALKKLKMPEKKAQDPMLEMDEMESMEEAPMEPSEDEMPMEEAPASPLDDIADEELFAEFQKRGLKPEDMQNASPEEEMPLEEIPEEEAPPEEY